MFLFGKKAYLLKWQNVVLYDKMDKLITTESQLQKMTQEAAANDLRIINDCRNLVATTLNPVTFFMRLKLLVDKAKHLCILEPYLKFSGPSPTDGYNEILDNFQLAIAEFLKRYYYETVSKAEAMKTEKGKRGKYHTAYYELSEHFDIMSEENRNYVLEKFKPKAEL